MQEDAPIVILHDEAQRSLECYVESSMEMEGEEYVLLMPVETPVEIFTWIPDEEGESEEDEILVDLEEEEIEAIFSTAKAVLAEHDLILKKNALTLTVSGNIPEAKEDDIITFDLSDEDPELEEVEEFQLLATFYEKEQEYVIYTPRDPLLFFARMNKKGNPELLSPEEFKKLRPLLEEMLFDDLE